jgi:hypothetical protein
MNDTKSQDIRKVPMEHTMRKTQTSRTTRLPDNHLK